MSLHPNPNPDSTPSDRGMSSISPTPSSAAKNPRVPACVLCQTRKVKCDRGEPCYGCVKAGVECVTNLPASVRRRRRNYDEGQLAARLRRCEELLRGYDAKAQQNPNMQDGGEVGISQNSLDTQTLSQTQTSAEPHSDVEPGKMIVEHGMPRFVDNNLWTSLYDEFQDLKEMLQQPPNNSEDISFPASEASIPDSAALLLGTSPSTMSLGTIHPPPVQIFRLWQTFLDNVNPLSKILHAPTTQTLVLEASENLEAIPKNTEVLLFAIYTSAVASLDNEDCESLMGDSKSSLLRRYSAATQQALVDIGFLRTHDLVVLQAFVLFLLARRQHHDPHALWVLSGVAIRIGQRIGLHRDGTSLGLPAFETEIRRRLWWQIMLLDHRSAQLSGASSSSMATDWDTKMPASVNDGDLFPGMGEPPLEHTGQTEMTFCLVICEIAKFFKDLSEKSAGGSWHGAGAGNWQNASKIAAGSSTVQYSGSSASSAWQSPDYNTANNWQSSAGDNWRSFNNSDAGSFSFKDKLMNDLENHIESKFLRYCDSSIPLHQLSITVARSIISTMKLMAHHPRQRPDKGAGMSQEEKNVLFELSMKIIQYDIQAHTMQIMKRFVWHINVYFQLDVFVFMLSELHHRPVGQLADKAWEYVEELHKFHPELLADDSNALYLAIGNLTLRVWGAREAELIRKYQRVPRTPGFISSLRSQRMIPDTSDHSMSFNHQHEQQQGQRREVNTQFEAHQSDLNAQVGAIGYGDTIPMYDHAGRYEDSSVDMNSMDWDYWNQLLASDLQSVGNSGQQSFR